jgi:hypothetical protein
MASNTRSAAGARRPHCLAAITRPETGYPTALALPQISEPLWPSCRGCYPGLAEVEYQVLAAAQCRRQCADPAPADVGTLRVGTAGAGRSTARSTRPSPRPWSPTRIVTTTGCAGVGRATPSQNCRDGAKLHVRVTTRGSSRPRHHGGVEGGGGPACSPIGPARGGSHQGLREGRDAAAASVLPTVHTNGLSAVAGARRRPGMPKA